jgi:DNA-binding NtrC family response regulator
MWVAADPASQRVLEQAQQVAVSDSPVLIYGEAGTGKKLLATLIHELSNASAPLIYFSPKSLPVALIETELFGEETSGYVQRGRLELAHGGTLVLDELAALPDTAQARLLRVMDDKSFQRPGGSRSVSANTRVIAVTALTPEHAQQSGVIRGDLLAHFRSAGLPLPALRDHPGDIAPLAARFLEAYAALQRTTTKSLSSTALAALHGYAFGGNVAELKHIVEQAATRCRGLEITADELPRHLSQAIAEASGVRSLEDVEREHIAKVLHFTNGRKTEAADLLGISRKTLLEKRKRYGLG